MPIAIPETLERAWGREVLDAFLPWLDQILEEKTVRRDEFREVLLRLDSLDKDVSLLKDQMAETRADVRDLRREMNQRFDRVNECFDRVNERFDRVNERFDQMYDRMVVMLRWTVGTLALLGTVISILLAIGQFIR